ncbi:MAG: 4Fe-4S dicluster domain-containing protein [Bacillota bacterium]
MTAHAILQDMSLCMECQACRVACQMQNQLPPEKVFVRFNFKESGSYPNVRHNIARITCFHCKDAVCVSSCPTGANWKGESGLTHHDPTYCGGCTACVVDCPFSVPVMQDGKAIRCNGCEALTENGKAPACVSTCISGALTYGPRGEMLKRAEKRVATLRGQGYPRARIYSPQGVGTTGLIWVLRDMPQAYGLPANPKTYGSLPDLKEIGGARQAASTAAALVVGALGWVIARREQLKEENRR